MPRESDDLRHGTLDILILKALTADPMHGYAIAKWIGDRAGGELTIIDAALYKALHRLESDGAIRSEWGLSENNRKAKYYAITPAGRARLRSQAPLWHRYADGIAAALRSTSHEPAR